MFAVCRLAGPVCQVFNKLMDQNSHYKGIVNCKKMFALTHKYTTHPTAPLAVPAPAREVYRPAHKE